MPGAVAGAIVSGTSHVESRLPGHVGSRLQGEVQLFFAHLNESAAGKSLFDPASLLAMLKLLGVFQVGRDAAGRPLEVPAALAEANP